MEATTDLRLPCEERRSNMASADRVRWELLAVALSLLATLVGGTWWRRKDYQFIYCYCAMLGCGGLNYIAKLFLVIQLQTMPSWVCFHFIPSKETSLQHPCCCTMYHAVSPPLPFHVQFLAPSILADPFQSGHRLGASLAVSGLSWR